MNSIHLIPRARGTEDVYISGILTAQEAASLNMYACYAGTSPEQVIAEQLAPVLGMQAKVELEPQDGGKCKCCHGEGSIFTPYGIGTCPECGGFSVQTEMKAIICTHCDGSGQAHVGTWSGECCICDGLGYVTRRTNGAEKVRHFGSDGP